jgi:integrase
MKDRRRVRLARGIYQDQCGLAAVVTLHGQRREQRYPLETDLAVLESWQTQTRAELDREHDADGPPIVRGTLAGDAPRYLAQIAGRAGFKADRSHLQAWIDRYGPMLRSKLTAQHVRVALAEWKIDGTWRGGRGKAKRASIGEPASAKTLIERWRVLRHFYKTLDGPKAKTPCDDVERPTRQASTPVGVHISIVQRVADRLAKRAARTPMRSPERKDHARYLMLATTLQRPAQLMRAIAEDFHLREQFWIVRGAKGGPTHAIHLNAEMRTAVKTFLQAGALGAYDDKKLLEVCRAHGWPKTIPLYNTRHSGAIDAITAGADLGDVQAMLGHASIETTRRFYAGIIRLRQKGVGKRLEGRLTLG